ncbi:xanthine dehydrogenase small subunit [Hoeflea sp. YIM 152468]|uniref:xanthine dehydrogenase small subunit n=1 Tax=Hoeflea sp. YIM 152468 TaxID=3031759 RepID=UPI0023DCE917|nr:xanthine dehydrogenase small subunit [Hoeflea sp. YIM 152468]MDF1606644.1 xanthine dehydrogenase small subunit [Hoeflea sp. YIM 152468]
MAQSHRTFIRFLLNDRPVELSGFAPDLSLLDWLRINQRLTGTKEGCAEGDCGACTVLVGRLDNGILTYETINACIRFVGSLDATHVVTIEHLNRPDGALSAVQQAMVDNHGSQCGFCTPGIVASLHGLWLSDPEPTEADIERALQGNLCRCTGYEPIVKAAVAAAKTIPSEDNDRLVAGYATTIATLTDFADGARVTIDSERGTTFLPADVDDLADIYDANPDATIVAGSTDVGLWVTKHMREIAPVIFIGHLAGLQQISFDETGVTLGAGVSYTAARGALIAAFPQMAEIWDRIGGEQVRNMGTVGGNIANGSPIGDTPPPLIALDASVTLRKGKARRTLPLEAFFIEYGKQDRQQGEFVESIAIPALDEDAFFAVYKISKRRDEDISALCAAFHVTTDAQGLVVSARLAFGGMAGTPKRAPTAEAALIGQPWSWDTIQIARAALAEDFQPLSDWRASADYRMLSAQNLMIRFFLETCGAPVRIERHPALAEA